MKRLLVLLLAAAGACAAPAWAAEDAGLTRWYAIISGDGAPIGHASRESRATPLGREIIDTQETALQEKGGGVSRTVSRTVATQDSTGRTVSISATSRSGQDWSRSEATIDADTARIVRETPTERRTVTVPLPPQVRFDGGEGLLQSWTPGDTPPLAFDSFNLEAMLVEHVVIEALPGDGFQALRRRYDGDQLRAVARLTLDQNRQIVAVSQPMFGTRITVQATDRATATRPHPPHRALPTMMTKSPYRIAPSAIGSHIRYRFSFRDGLAFAPPQTGEQRVTLSPAGAVLDICETCGPGLPSDPAALAEALRPTAWMQSDHPRLLAIATPVARLRVSDSRKMQILLERARPYLTRIDFAGHYSALDTLSRRSGDCTEAAVLLAALGRAAGIPTKVVNGLVYSRERYHGVSNAFMPHSWTLAWVDGQWRSFDLALDAFDSTHIALTIGDGDARSILAAGQLASLLGWDGMTEVRSRPGS